MKLTDKDLMDISQGAYTDIRISKGGDTSFSNVTGIKGHDDLKVVNAFDDEEATGFYAYLIDTNDGNCVVAFRGTTGFNDVVFADAALVNSGETAQQQKAREYLRFVNEKFGDRYKSITITGHSLGGNLAEDVVITASPELRQRCTAVSLDGPGFSQQYIEEHKNEIVASEGRLRRYQWSMVGTNLNPLPGESYSSVYVETPEIDPAIKTTLEILSTIPFSGVQATLVRQVMESFALHTNYDNVRNCMDESGYFKRGDAEAIATQTMLLSRFTDIIIRMSNQNLLTSLAGVPVLAALKNLMGIDFSKYGENFKRMTTVSSKSPWDDSVTVLPEDGSNRKATDTVENRVSRTAVACGNSSFTVKPQQLKNNAEQLQNYADVLKESVSSVLMTLQKMPFEFSEDRTVFEVTMMVTERMIEEISQLSSLENGLRNAANTYMKSEEMIVGRLGQSIPLRS